MDKWGTLKHHSKRIWHFFWHEDSLASWIANIIIAFIVIRFIVYPVLGLLLGTSYPIVAVVSESMQHGLDNNVLCGRQLNDFQYSFDNYWQVCGQWYGEKNISKEQFKHFPFRNGFDKGDVVILWRANPSNINIGDILIFQGSKPQPIIHRVVRIWREDANYLYQTKGDHNANSITGHLGETQIDEKRIVGKGLLRIPYLGWLKIFFVDAVRPLGITIQR